MKRQFLSPKDEEERRKILKMLVTPRSNSQSAGGNKSRHHSSASFDQMIIKAARSAENIVGSEELIRFVDRRQINEYSNLFSLLCWHRKQSSLSLQIPGMGPNSSNGNLANKKVTFSQVVDQMACSLSDSSSLSDLSCADDLKMSLSGNALALAGACGKPEKCGRLFFFIFLFLP